MRRNRLKCEAVKGDYMSRNKMLFLLAFSCGDVGAEELKQFVTNASVGGELRTIYQYNSYYTYLDGTHGPSNTGVLGGKIGLTSGQINGFDAVFGGYGAFRAFEDKNRVDVDYLNNGKNNADYAVLGESFLRYSSDASMVRIGHFMLDTPLLGSDDVRTVPNFFEGIHTNVKVADSLKLDLGYIDAIAGWENLSDNSKFENIGDAIDNGAIFSNYKVGKSFISFGGYHT